LASALASP